MNSRIGRGADAASLTSSTELELGAAGLLEAATLGPCQEDIAQLAYSYWEQRGCQGGTPEDDWFRAESELRAQFECGSSQGDAPRALASSAGAGD